MSISERITQLLSKGDRPRKLAHAFYLLARWRERDLEQAVAQHHNGVVPAGPFAGLDVSGVRTELSRALGVYEAALHPIVEQIVETGYPVIIDVGCAEGYYAVGLAQRMPATTVHAREIDTAILARCQTLAANNGVQERIQFGGEVEHSFFDLCKTQKTLVICDVEGAENDLIDPTKAPGLLDADILVECHDCFTRGLSEKIAQRFHATHDISLIHRTTRQDLLPDWMNDLDDLSRLVATWEHRPGPTPWLWMTRKNT